MILNPQVLWESDGDGNYVMTPDGGEHLIFFAVTDDEYLSLHPACCIRHPDHSPMSAAIK